MKWTKEDEEVLKSYIEDSQDDNNKLKHEVFEKLARNKYICHVLNNEALEDEDAEPDDYLYENIIPYEIIHPTQVKVKNFICVLTRQTELYRYDKAIKLQQIIFKIYCEQANGMVNSEFPESKNTLIPLGMARHDLIAALIKTEFNYYPLSCGKIRLVQDTEDATDTDYATRMLIFECYTDANLTKNINGQQQMINKVWS